MVMNKTFQIAFRLKNSYRANSVIFSLKQVPLLKRILPDSLYGFQDLKVLANIIAGVWEFFFHLCGKISLSAAAVRYLSSVQQSESGSDVFCIYCFF